jgi:hypothetical protein
MRPQKGKVFLLTIIIVIGLWYSVNSSDVLYFNANILIWVLIFFLTFIDIYLYNFLYNMVCSSFQSNVPEFFNNKNVNYFLILIIFGITTSQIEMHLLAILADILNHFNSDLGLVATKVYESLFDFEHTSIFNSEILNYIIDIFRNSFFAGLMAIAAIIILNALCKILKLSCKPNDLIDEIKKVIKNSIIINTVLTIHNYLMKKSIIYKLLISVIKTLPGKIAIILQIPLVPLIGIDNLGLNEKLGIFIIYEIFFVFVCVIILVRCEKYIKESIYNIALTIIGFLGSVFIFFLIKRFYSVEDPFLSFRKASLIAVCAFIIILTILNLILKARDESDKKIKPKIQFNLKIKMFYNKYIKNFINKLKILFGIKGGERMETYKMKLDFGFETEKNRVLFVADSSGNMLRWTDKENRKFSEKVIIEIAGKVLGLNTPDKDNKTTDKDNKIDLICCNTDLIEESKIGGFVQDPSELINKYLKKIDFSKEGSKIIDYDKAIDLALNRCKELYESDARYTIILISNFSKGKGDIETYCNPEQAKKGLELMKEIRHFTIYVVACPGYPQDLKKEICDVYGIAEERWFDTMDGEIKDIRLKFKELTADFEVKLNLQGGFSFKKASIEPKQGISDIVWDSQSLNDKLPVEVELSHTGEISSLPYVSFEKKYNIKLKKHNLSLNKAENKEDIE